MSETETDAEREAGSPIEDEVQEEEDEEKEEQPEPKPLTTEILAESLSLLCKTGNSLSHAYVRVDLRDRELTDINALRPFVHLRYVDISGNMIQDISPLANLSQLLWVSAEGNNLSSAQVEELPFLQVANFARNSIRDTEGIFHPLLETINLNHNQIREVTGLDPIKLSRLHTLELRGNLLESTRGIILPNLHHLYLAANTISRLEDLDTLTSLQTLHLRENHIETLRGFSPTMVALQYINLRSNLIVEISELKHLECVPNLRALVLADNPCSEEDSHRLEALLAVPGLERLDKDNFGIDERAEAASTRKQREEEAAEKAAKDQDIEGMDKT